MAQKMINYGRNRFKNNKEKKGLFDASPDPFFSKQNMDILTSSVNDMKAGRNMSEHEFVERHYPAVKSDYRISARSRNLYSRNFFRGKRSSDSTQAYIAQCIAVELPESLSVTASGMIKSFLRGMIHE